MSAEDLQGLLLREVPDALFQRVLRAVFAAHRIALEDCVDTYAPTETENVLPYMRRARVEGFIRDAVAMVPGATSEVVRSKNSNWNHSEVRAGRVIITASSVQSPCALVEPAEFRQTLARDSQYALWPEPGDEPDDNAPLYAVLLHGKSHWMKREDREKYSHLPGSVYIAIPAPDLKSYVAEINLLDRYPGIVEEHVPQEWDQAAKISYLRQGRKIIAS